MAGLVHLCTNDAATSDRQGAEITPIMQRGVVGGRHPGHAHFTHCKARNSYSALETTIFHECDVPAWRFPAIPPVPAAAVQEVFSGNFRVLTQRESVLRDACLAGREQGPEARASSRASPALARSAADRQSYGSGMNGT